jgi:Glycosyltransferase sugar-binding region containing DXD motif
VFADWFRYRLLLERGGIWADADMVCLRPLEYASDEVFAWQDDKLVNNAVLGLRAGHPLAEWLATSCEHPNRVLPYDEWAVRLRKLKRRVLGNRRENVRWGESGPEALTRGARHLGYLDAALPSWHFYPVPFEDAAQLFADPLDGRPTEFGESRAVHLWNQVLKGRDGLDKNARFSANSAFERLWARYTREAV